MFGRNGGPTADERTRLIHLARELSPLAYRSRDGAKARALQQIEDAAERLRAAEDKARRNRLTVKLLDFLDDLGFDVGKHWRSRLTQCSEMLLRVRIDSGEWRPGAAGLLADLLIASDPQTYGPGDRRKLVDALAKASKRGAQTM